MKAARSIDELEQVREKILDAALHIIINEGFEAFTMRKLASRIGMSAPNIYNYFSSKDELYITIVIKGFEMLHESLKNAYEGSLDPFIRARCLIDAYMTFGMENSAYYDIMFTRATPKYNDYVGTPYEKLSEVEYGISMEIARLAMSALRDLIGDNAASENEIVMKNVVKVWGILHGMISLNNSRIIGYVAHSADQVYEQIIDDLMDSLSRLSE